MDLQSATKDESKKDTETSVVENDKDLENGRGVVIEAKGENEVVETSGEEKNNEKFVETLTETKEGAASKPLVEENKAENEMVREASILASAEANSSEMIIPSGLRAKNKIVKKVKKIVKRRLVKGTPVQRAAEENVSTEHSIKEGVTVIDIKKDEKSAEPSSGESDKQTKKVVECGADSSQPSGEKEKEIIAEASVGGDDVNFEKVAEGSVKAHQPADDVEKVAGVESSAEKTLNEPKEKESVSMIQGTKEGVNLESIVSDKIDAGASSAEACENAMPKENKQPRRPKAKAKYKKTPAALRVRTKMDKAVKRGDHENNNGFEKLNSVENACEGSQQKTFAEKNKQSQLTEGKTDLAEDKTRNKKRRGKNVLGSSEKHRKESAASDVTQQRMQERKGRPIDPEKKETDGRRKGKIGGLIFMCNSKTKPDCFRFRVMGVSENKKDFVMGIKPGLKLFLYDYDKKLLYGIFQASSPGGMKLECDAFGGSFPAQVRFKFFSDCLPLPESQFRKAIKENYNKNKFKTELTHKQVFKLKKLFRPVTLPAHGTTTQPILAPRDVNKKKSDKDRYVPGSSRTHRSERHERSRNHHASPPRREEPSRDLYLSEREYRAYGLRRGETSQHYQVPPPDPYHSVNRERVALDSYHPGLDHDRLLRHADIERHDLREALHRDTLHLPERDYHTYDHLNSRRELLVSLPRNSPLPPLSAVALDPYRRDTYYSHDHQATERPSRSYVASSGREDDLYSRYVTLDSLAEYYQSRRYSSVAQPEVPLSVVASRYTHPGPSSFSRR